MTSKLLCHSLHTYPVDDNLNRFVNVGAIPNSQHIFECGTLVDGKPEINAYINTDGTCSFVNSNAVTFSGLADVPHHYQEQNGKVVVVGDNCLVFSDALKIKLMVCESVKADFVEIFSLNVKGNLKANVIEMESFKQTSYAENTFLGTVFMNKTNTNNLFCKELETNKLNVIGDMDIAGDTVLHTLTSKDIFNSGKAILGEVSGTMFLMDILECENHAKIKQIESNNLTVYETSVLNEIKAQSLNVSENIESYNLKSSKAEFERVVANVVIADTVLSKSVLCFGTQEFPQVFLPNEKRYIGVEMSMNNLRGHGYGFSPTQCLDTIILKIKTNHKLENCDVKIGFRYYNSK
jgi:hypothetical protein